VSPQLRKIIRSRIIVNDLKPNTKLSEPEMAKEYNVSRQPVREAFITLVNEGLLEIRPQRGTFVKKIDYEAVLDARFVREAVEADIVSLLAAQHDRNLIVELRSQLKEQRRVARHAPFDFMKLDEKFHRTLAKAAKKGKAWRILDDIKSQMDRVRYLSNEKFPVGKLIKQHKQIIDYIEIADANNATLSMRSHLREILADLPKVQRLYPEYFEGSWGTTTEQ
jgi:DNA-binding GntR family transcriptional regulator